MRGPAQHCATRPQIAPPSPQIDNFHSVFNLNTKRKDTKLHTRKSDYPTYSHNSNNIMKQPIESTIESKDKQFTYQCCV